MRADTRSKQERKIKDMQGNYYLAISIKGETQFKIGFKTKKERDEAAEFQKIYSTYTLERVHTYDDVVKLMFI